MSNNGIEVGVKVKSGSKVGTVMYVGEVDFQRGTWVGIEWDDPVGKHDGAVKGKRYSNFCKKKIICLSPKSFSGGEIFQM